MAFTCWSLSFKQSPLAWEFPVACYRVSTKVYCHCERSEAISHFRLLRPLRFAQRFGSLAPRNDSYNVIFLRPYPCSLLQGYWLYRTKPWILDCAWSARLVLYFFIGLLQCLIPAGAYIPIRVNPAAMSMDKRNLHHLVSRLWSVYLVMLAIFILSQYP